MKQTIFTFFYIYKEKVFYLRKFSTLVFSWIYYFSFLFFTLRVSYFQTNWKVFMFPICLSLCLSVHTLMAVNNLGILWNSNFIFKFIILYFLLKMTQIAVLDVLNTVYYFLPISVYQLVCVWPKFYDRAVSKTIVQTSWKYIFCLKLIQFSTH